MRRVTQPARRSLGLIRKGDERIERRVRGRCGQLAVVTAPELARVIDEPRDLVLEILATRVVELEHALGDMRERGRAIALVRHRSGSVGPPPPRSTLPPWISPRHAPVGVRTPSMKDLKRFRSPSTRRSSTPSASPRRSAVPGVSYVISSATRVLSVPSGSNLTEPAFGVPAVLRHAT